MDLTGEAQHVFEKDSTVTAGLTLESMISRALNQTKFCLMSSLELSAAFDVINYGVVIKRLRIIRLPQVVTALIDGWLNLIL
jgi:hypothetical protein